MAVFRSVASERQILASVSGRGGAVSSRRRSGPYSVFRDDSRHGAPSHRRVLALAVSAAFAAYAASTLANPSGGTVVSGGATFQLNGNTLNITNTPGAIINWQQFSIGKDEITRFIQQNAASGILNRVTGQNPSAIFGQLLSNGRVFLINPSGIAFGQGAVIDVAGFAASTLNISDADWLSGRMRFVGSGAEGKLTNAGTIRTPEGGHVYLIAPNVENQASGVITSPKGEVVIAAGNSVELVNASTPGIRVELSAPENEAINAGQVVASSGNVGIYGTLIKNSGLVSASRAEIGDGGKIVFKAVKDVTLDATSRIEATGAQGGAIKLQAEGGTLLAEGVVEAKGEQEKGGEIQLLGKQVGLIGNASVDASGDRGGGMVLVGGDYQGKNPDVQNAEKTYVGRDAVIRADAGTDDDGGKIIVWSDGTTRFYGTLSARGGSKAGNGGFAEVSGKISLDASIAHVDLGAPKGASGTLLLDPQDIVINGGTADGSDTETGNSATLLQQNGGTGGEILFTDGPDLFNIYESEIENTDANINLQARNSITVTGTFNVNTNGEGTGSIVRLKTDRSLTLDTQNAAGDGTGSSKAPGINLAGVEFQTQGTGSITVRAGITGTSPAGETADISLGPLTALGTGGILVATGKGSINAQSAVSANAGTVTLTTGETDGATETGTPSTLTLSADLTGSTVKLDSA
ncbi:MAG: filamentous hemagglutinin N-terminal domain-containing protein, partial [Betaproteobacteria bacterium]